MSEIREIEQAEFGENEPRSQAIDVKVASFNWNTGLVSCSGRSVLWYYAEASVPFVELFLDATVAPTIMSTTIVNVVAHLVRGGATDRVVLGQFSVKTQMQMIYRVERLRILSSSPDRDPFPISEWRAIRAFQLELSRIAHGPINADHRTALVESIRMLEAPGSGRKIFVFPVVVFEGFDLRLRVNLTHSGQGCQCEIWWDSNTKGHDTESDWPLRITFHTLAGNIVAIADAGSWYCRARSMGRNVAVVPASGQTSAGELLLFDRIAIARIDTAGRVDPR